MNWSRSVVALRWVRASTPAGYSPRGLGVVCDSFEGFSMLHRGTLILSVLEARLVPFHQSQLVAGKPPSLCTSEGIAHLCHSTPAHPLG
jgi:hypothetical protein